MSTFDSIFYSVFKHYKGNQKQKANTIALLYISCLQIALILVLGVFISLFLKEMYVNTITSTKAWTLFIMASIFVYFRNWILYTGRKRKLLNAKTHKNKVIVYNIWLLWLLLLGCIFLALILLNAW
ncbi:hypothetical protein [uncultured Psychroserpens sp.]|uniref:hypothetical protein n=1 Tax=uncultured Psychroserpens sp. TaxID=255436 RepID=UPI0026149501|nr:hypothetical protein [uncultured Psychroserpens sp.]